MHRFSYLLALGVIWATATTAIAATPGEVAQAVDKQLADELGLVGTVLAPSAPDEVFVRRVYLDIVGEMPTPEEVTVFALDPAADKRAKLVDKLLADHRYGTNWARYWRDVIFYRRTEDRALITSPAFEQWCANELNRGASWNGMATELITATGNIQEEGRTALIVAQQAQPEEITAEVSRIFLGIQIQCAQCHDHVSDRWKREQFHELAAFFPRVAMRPTEPNNMRSLTVYSDDLPQFRQRNNDNRFRGDAEHTMPNLKDPSAKGQVMTPVFFATGQKLELGQTDQERRKTVSQWITSNEWFARAYVNRLWAELVGEGFYEPIDDLGPDHACSAPKTLELLANGFRDSKYDPRWLLRAITATEAYQRQSRPRRNSNDKPFASNASQRLRADQILTSLLNVLGVEENASANVREMVPRAYERNIRFAFNTVFGYDPSAPREEVSGSIPQALLLMNGQQVNAGISAARTNAGIGKLLATVKDDKALVVELYMRTLAREPNERELATLLAYVKQVGNRNEAFEDITWTLINSAEFLHRR